MAFDPRLPISFRLFSAHRKNARSLAPKLWSTLPTQFQNRSRLKCSVHSRLLCHGATPAVLPLGAGQYFMIAWAVGLMRFVGMMLPGKGSRVQTPLTSRPVSGSKIWIRLPWAFTRPLKPPRLCASVGTVLDSGAGVPSLYFSPVNRKNVLFFQIGPSTENPYWSMYCSVFGRFCELRMNELAASALRRM